MEDEGFGNIEDCGGFGGLKDISAVDEFTNEEA